MSVLTTNDPSARIRKALPWLVLVLVFILLGMPIGMLFFGAFRDAPPGQPGSMTFDGIRYVIEDPRTVPAYLNALGLGLGMATLGTMLAAGLAYISARSKTFLARSISPLMVIVLAMPPLFFALSWDMIGSPGVGLINELTHPMNLPQVDVGGASGSVFVGGLKVASLVYFILLGPFSAMDHRLEEAGRISGSGWLGTFIRVTLPSLSPALIGAFIIALVVGLTAFDIPLIIGIPEGFNVMSTQIYGYLNETSPPNYASAGALAMILVSTVIAAVAIRWWLLDRRSFTTVGGKSGGQIAEEGLTSKFVSGAVVIFAGLLLLILPIAQMILASFQGIFGSNTSISLRNYVAILNDPFLADMLWNTFIVAGIGGLLAVSIAFLLAMLGRYGSRFLRRALDLMTWLPWAANGILLGLGLVWTFLSIPFLRGAFGTIWILLIGLVIVSIPIASRAIEGALAQISTELEEAGRMSGASTLRVSFDIVLRLLLPAFLAGWFICAVNIIGNLEVPILLSLPTNPTLPVTVYQLYSNGQVTQAAALFCFVLGLAIAIGLLIWLVITGFRRAYTSLEKQNTEDGGAGEGIGSLHQEDHATATARVQASTDSKAQALAAERRN